MPAHINHLFRTPNRETLIADHVPPTEISQELQYKKYENHFPVPVLENVYEGWDPVDHGHPLKDETLFYAPPSLERVVFSPQGPQSRYVGYSSSFEHLRLEPALWLAGLILNS